MNNKKKLIIGGFVIIVLIILPIIVVGNIRTLKYNEEGKPIVHSAKEMNELKDGTEFVYAIPSNTSITKSDKEISEEKRKILENVSNSSVAIKSLTVEEKEKYAEEISEHTKEDIKDKEQEEEFKRIFIKFYSEKELEEVLSSMENEIDEYMRNNPGNYIFPESGKVLLRRSIEMINSKDIAESEKETIIYVIGDMDLTTLNDDNLRNELKEIGIK